MKQAIALTFLSASFFSLLPGQALPLVDDVEPQPLVAQVVRLGEALSFLGSPPGEPGLGADPGPEGSGAFRFRGT